MCALPAYGAAGSFGHRVHAHHAGIAVGLLRRHPGDHAAGGGTVSGPQVYDIIFARDNVANFMHIVGGVCGTAFGYVYAMLPRKRRRPAARKKR